MTWPTPYLAWLQSDKTKTRPGEHELPLFSWEATMTQITTTKYLTKTRLQRLLEDRFPDHGDFNIRVCLTAAWLQELTDEAS